MVGVTDDSEPRMRALLTEASALVGEGQLHLQVVSSPVVEWVYVGLEDDQVVVSDDGATFGWIARHHGDEDEYEEWSPDRARVPAEAFGVSLVDETERTADGEVLATGWRLQRPVSRGESVADAVQSVAQAIDGVLAVHVREGGPTHGSYFWDHRSEEGDPG